MLYPILKIEAALLIKTEISTSIFIAKHTPIFGITFT
jgi:hypothetical protein